MLVFVSLSAQEGR